MWVKETKNSLFAQSMTSIVSYPQRCNQWGSPGFRGNCDGQLFKNLVPRYGARRVADPMMGSGTTKDVIDGLEPNDLGKLPYELGVSGECAGELKEGDSHLPARIT